MCSEVSVIVVHNTLLMQEAVDKFVSNNFGEGEICEIMVDILKGFGKGNFSGDSTHGRSSMYNIEKI